MKKCIICILFFLTGCIKTPFVKSEISRSQIYYGQPVADLQDNFGVPSRVEKNPYEVVVFIYDKQDIVSGRTEKIIKNCTLRVYAHDERVIDWEWKGNNCQFKVKPPQSLLLDDFNENFNTPNTTKEYEDMFDY